MHVTGGTRVYDMISLEDAPERSYTLGERGRSTMHPLQPEPMVLEPAIDPAPNCSDAELGKILRDYCLGYFSEDIAEEIGAPCTKQEIGRVLTCVRKGLEARRG